MDFAPIFIVFLLSGCAAKMPSLGASDLAPHVSFPQQSNPLSLSTDGQNPRNGESQPTRDIAKSPNPKREIESHNAGKYPDASRYEVSYGDGVFVNKI
ncbi:hypothetical protein [Hyphomicrobium sp. ghe19]|uniref:hypothetical protein n=1 Tax=Hyphomicrobium sp. ghe19 TaxID=2682968 RepID=UPI0030D15BAF